MISEPFSKSESDFGEGVGREKGRCENLLIWNKNEICLFFRKRFFDKASKPFEELKLIVLFRSIKFNMFICLNHLVNFICTPLIKNDKELK